MNQKSKIQALVAPGQSAQSKRTWLFMFSVLVGTMAVFFTARAITSNYGKLPFYSNMGDKKELFSMEFNDQEGELITLKDHEGKILVVNFIFSHCPTICPEMSRNMQDVHQMYIDREELELLSFSVDPKRDSVERLAYFAGLFNADPGQWHFLTGAKTDIYRLARSGFAVTATDGDGGPDDFIHSPLFVLMDQDKNIRGFYDGTDKPQMNQLIKDIGKLL